MIVERAQRARVLVETSGDIALNIGREFDRGRFGSWLWRGQQVLMLGTLSVGLIGIVWAAQRPEQSFVESEQRLTDRLVGLESRLNQLATSAADQSARSGVLMTKIDSVATAVDAVPARVGSSIERGTSTVLTVLSDLQLRPAFPLASGGKPVAETAIPAPLAAQAKRTTRWSQVARLRPRRARFSMQPGLAADPVD